MAEANTNSVQQAQDAQHLDNLTSLQQGGPQNGNSAGGTADATVNTSNPNQPDNPSLFNNANPVNNNNGDLTAKGNDSVLTPSAFANDGREGGVKDTPTVSTGTQRPEINPAAANAAPAAYQNPLPDIRGNNGIQEGPTSPAAPAAQQATQTINQPSTIAAVKTETEPTVQSTVIDENLGNQPVAKTPELSIWKSGVIVEGISDLDGLVEADDGSVAKYTVILKNTGESDLSNLIFNDQKIPNKTYILEVGTYEKDVSGNYIFTPLASQPVIDGVAINGVLNIGSEVLGPNVAWRLTYEYEINQADIDSGSITNTVTVDSNLTDPDSLSLNGLDPNAADPTDGVASYTTTIAQSKELLITKAGTVYNADGSDDSDGKVDSASDRIDYVVTVKNTGNVTLTNVNVDDPMLPGLKLTGGDVNNNGKLDVGEVWEYTGTYQVTQGDIDEGLTLRNIATVDTDQTDPTGDAQENSSNKGIVSFDIEVDRSPELSVWKSGVINPGKLDSVIDSTNDEVDYTILVKNSGNTSLDHLILKDLKVVGSNSLKYWDHDGNGSKEYTITLKIGTVAVGDNGHAYFTDSSNHETVIATVGADGQITLPPDFKLLPGQALELDYSYQVTQEDLNGTGQATNLIAYTDIDSGGAYKYNYDASETQRIFTNVDNFSGSNAFGVGAGVMSGVADGKHDHIMVNSTKNALISFTNSTDVEVAFDATLSNGSNAKYSIVINQSGGYTAGQTPDFKIYQINLDGQRGDLVDNNSHGIVLSWIDGAGGSQNIVYTLSYTPESSSYINNFDFWVVGKVEQDGDLTSTASGNLKVVDISTEPILSTGITNTVTVDSNLTDPDSLSLNGLDPNAADPTDGVASYTTTIAQSKELLITKAGTVYNADGSDDSDGKVDSASDRIDYVVTVKNTGNVTLTNVNVDDPMLPGLKLTGGDVNNNGKLDVGEVWEYTGTYQVTQGDIDEGLTLRNIATVDTDQTDPTGDAQENSSNKGIVSFDIEVDRSPELSVWKSGVINPGKLDSVIDSTNDEVDYTILVKNSGNTSLDHLILKDLKVVGSNSLKYWDHDGNGSKEYTITLKIGTVAVGDNGHAYFTDSSNHETVIATVGADGQITLPPDFKLLPGQALELDYSYQVTQEDLNDNFGSEHIHQQGLSIQDPGVYSSTGQLLGSDGAYIGDLFAYTDVNPSGSYVYSADTTESKNIHINIDNTPGQFNQSAGSAAGIGAGVMSGTGEGNHDHILFNFADRAIKSASISFTNSTDVEVAFDATLSNGSNAKYSIVINQSGGYTAGQTPDFKIYQINADGTRGSSAIENHTNGVDLNWSYSGSNGLVYTITANAVDSNDSVRSFDFWVVGKVDNKGGLESTSTGELKLVDLNFSPNFGELVNVVDVDSNQTDVFSATHISESILYSYLGGEVIGIPTITGIAEDLGGGNPHTRILTPTIDGIAEAGRKIYIYDDGQLVGTGYSNGNGEFSIKVDAAFTSAGAHTLTAVATNSYGSFSGHSNKYTITIDEVKPNTPTVHLASDTLSTKNQNVEVQVNVDNLIIGNVIELKDKTGKVIGTHTILSDDLGNGSSSSIKFSVNVNDVKEGRNDIYASVKSPLNQFLSESSSIVSLYKDTAASVAINGFSTDSGVVGDFITNDATPTIFGTADSGSSIQISVDGKLLATVEADQAGNWTYTTPEDGKLTDGSHIFSVIATDTNGNVTTAALSNIAIDTIKPILGIKSLGISSDSGLSSSDFITNVSHQTISVQLDGTGPNRSLGQGESVMISVDNGDSWKSASLVNQNSNRYELADVDLGASGSILARVQDTAGNYSEVYAQSYLVDTAAPSPLATGKLSSDTGTSSIDGITKDGTIALTLSSDTSQWQYSTDGGKTWSSSFNKDSTTSFTLNAGSYAADMIQVKEFDLAGNASSPSKINSGAITVDTTAPSPLATGKLSSDTGTSSIDGITKDGTIALTLSSDTSQWQYSTDGGKTWSSSFNKDSTTSFTLNAGSYAADMIQVKEFDLAGNASSPSKINSGAITVDTTAPSPLATGKLSSDTGTSSIDGITKDGTIALTLSSDTSQWQYSTDGGKTWSSSFNKDSTTSFTLNAGSYAADMIQVKEFDLAGNASSPSKINSGAITVDTTIASISSIVGSKASGSNYDYTVKWTGNLVAGDFIYYKSAVNSYTAQQITSADILTGSIKFTSINNANAYFKDAAGNQSATVASPIAFDLNEDGHVNYLSSSSGVSHDYNHDGIAESTAWVAPEDGLLALQKEDGTHNIVFSTQAGETDLAGLAKVYDSNKDGVLNQSDADFAKFGVWQDANSDGIVQNGEFLSLADRGITSLSLTSDGQVHFEANGDVIVYGQTTYTTSDGQLHIAEDVGFAVNDVYEPLDIATLISNAEAIESITHIDQLGDTASSSSLMVELGGQTYEIATLNGQEAGTQDILSQFVGGDTSNNLLANKSWTDVIDIASDHGGPSSITAAGGAVADGAYSNGEGDWTVIVKSGDAKVDAAHNQITFSSESAENSVTIITADGASHDINNVDKIQWHG